MFDSPYSAKPVDTDAYLYTAICYIALNPPDPTTWRWSSYHGLIGLSTPFSFVDTRLVLQVFGSADRLRQIVEAAWRAKNDPKPNLVWPQAEPGS